MRAFTSAVLAIALAGLVPTAVRAQDRVEVRLDARVVIPEFLIVKVASHTPTGEGTGRVELHVSANTNWDLSVSTSSADVDYRIVSSPAARTTQGAAVSQQKVIVEYSRRGNRAAAAAPSFEYAMTAR